MNKIRGNKVKAEENILKQMSDKRKSIENRRLYTAQNKMEFTGKRKTILNFKVKDGQCNRCNIWKQGVISCVGP